MTLVNDLIRRAKQSPSELTITANQVSGLAEHARSLMHKPWEDKGSVEASIKAGEVRFMGIPIRVIGGAQ